jgi:excisionase family DNA binding protein
MMPSLAGYIPTKEAADKLGYHVNHVRRMIRRGDFVTVRVGNMLFISVESIDAYQEKTKDFGKHDRTRRAQG